MPGGRSPQTQSTKLVPETAALDGFLAHGQLQLFPVRADGMQVGPVTCRFICSEYWFEGADECSYSRSKKPLNAGRAVFKYRSLHRSAINGRSGKFSIADVQFAVRSEPAIHLRVPCILVRRLAVQREQSVGVI